MYYKRKALKYIQRHLFTVFLKLLLFLVKQKCLTGFQEENLPREHSEIRTQILRKLCGRKKRGPVTLILVSPPIIQMYGHLIHKVDLNTRTHTHTHTHTHRVSLPYLRFCIQGFNQLQMENIQKKIPASSKKHNLNLPHDINSLQKTIAIDIISNLEMI